MTKDIDNVKYRRPLNKQQLLVLQQLYQFRFCTSRQLACTLNRPNSKSIQNKLQILEEQGFISKRYDASYKLAGRPAEYFITSRGGRELTKLKPDSSSEWASKNLYKNTSVSNDYLKHSLSVTDCAQHMQKLYGNDTWILPKSYTANYSDFPAWTPDLYLKLLATSRTPAKRYFVDIWDDTKPFFVSVRKLRNYVNFKEASDWSVYPAVLAICTNSRAQRKLAKQMKRILDDSWDTELIFAATTQQQFDNATKPSDKVWLKMDIEDEGEYVSLEELIVYDQ
ncbi:replication-relaxation family protein [Candidatus Saccharibacteria bacterium]|nr:replication-relaxation family protein [Candidatus Saccharibacteria bacterium]